MIVTDRVAWSVGLSVCLSASVVSPANTAEPIETPFGLWNRVAPRNHVLDNVHSAHWRNLANTYEPFMCAGDAAFCQITLTTCYHFTNVHSDAVAKTLVHFT